ncbi:hypothetical protein CO657_31390 (plasmid) [Rhizobium acidisoli]|uniref:Lipoprotein n=1 Tax=Rhizobium acidisoli TaxID=1538158 RepID=A0AAE5WTN5_9HYPH|nr:EexN family lipoprotein [Rhizobium acidisoli]KPH07041.1 hypothetical protein AOG23_20330 [Rhizobium acidisoli]QAS82307.1 hypothetical protein CO657_31390 [Rhizobium acidisoli]
MKGPLPGTVMLALSGCFGEKGRIYSVDERMADEVLPAKIPSKCRTNPGALRRMPNRQNAEAADWTLRLGHMNRALGG